MLHFKNPPKDDVELMREIVRNAVWDLIYHENELHKAHKLRGHLKALIASTGFSFTLKEACEFYQDECGENEDNINNTDECFKYMVGRMDSVDYHETELAIAHRQLGLIKILLARSDMPSINVDEIMHEQENEYRIRNETK